MRISDSSSDVCSSDLLRATASEPIVVPAPGLFSTITGCPSSRDMPSPNSREIRSVPPPGEKGTMIRTGRSGKAAKAGAEKPTNAAAATAMAAYRLTNEARFFCISVSYKHSTDEATRNKRHPTIFTSLNTQQQKKE